MLDTRWTEILGNETLVKKMTEIHEPEKLLELCRTAHAATTGEDIAVDPVLFREGIRYHIFMRRRLTIARVLPMLGLNLLDAYDDRIESAAKEA